jgi:trehalose 6-phosphate synthase
MGGCVLSRRLLVVSNRVAPIEEGKASVGGLSVAVEEALSEIGGLWFGWDGSIDNDGARVSLREGPKFSTATMPLGRRDYQQFYAGYSNATLWPMLHYRLDLMDYNRHNASGYRRVNELFAAKLAPLVRKDDLIWVHDYHLFLLGRELRRHGFGNRIGFFLHTPFPPPDILMACSDHEAIVRALLDYDLVGFQTDADVRNFSEYLRRRPDGRMRGSRAAAFGKETMVRAFPIGVYPEDIARTAAHATTGRQTRELVRSLGEQDFIIGVDRLDYSKGLDSRFAAYEKLLADYPGNRGHVSFVQIAPPSRGEVKSYQEIREKLERMTGKINGRFSDLDWTPLRYVNRNYRRDVLMGLFRAARVGFVTPLRDGMNLVAKEYVAAQNPEDPGVLVLSQFAGAAAELRDAVIVNPYDVEAVANGLQSALSLSLEERRDRHDRLMRVLSHNNLGVWQHRFLKALTEAA